MDVIQNKYLLVIFARYYGICPNKKTLNPKIKCHIYRDLF